MKPLHRLQRNMYAQSTGTDESTSASSRTPKRAAEAEAPSSRLRTKDRKTTSCVAAIHAAMGTAPAPTRDTTCPSASRTKVPSFLHAAIKAAEEAGKRPATPPSSRSRTVSVGTSSSVSLPSTSSSSSPRVRLPIHPEPGPGLSPDTWPAAAATTPRRTFGSEAQALDPATLPEAMDRTDFYRDLTARLDWLKNHYARAEPTARAATLHRALDASTMPDPSPDSWMKALQLRALQLEALWTCGDVDLNEQLLMAESSLHQAAWEHVGATQTKVSGLAFARLMTLYKLLPGRRTKVEFDRLSGLNVPLGALETQHQALYGNLQAEEMDAAYQSLLDFPWPGSKTREARNLRRYIVLGMQVPLLYQFRSPEARDRDLQGILRSSAPATTRQESGYAGKMEARAIVLDTLYGLMPQAQRQAALQEARDIRSLGELTRKSGLRRAVGAATHAVEVRFAQIGALVKACQSDALAQASGVVHAAAAASTPIAQGSLAETTDHTTLPDAGSPEWTDALDARFKRLRTLYIAQSSETRLQEETRLASWEAAPADASDGDWAKFLALREQRLAALYELLAPVERMTKLSILLDPHTFERRVEAAQSHRRFFQMEVGQLRRLYELMPEVASRDLEAACRVDTLFEEGQPGLLQRGLQMEAIHSWRSAQRRRAALDNAISRHNLRGHGARTGDRSAQIMLRLREIAALLNLADPAHAIY